MLSRVCRVIALATLCQITSFYTLFCSVLLFFSALSLSSCVFRFILRCQLQLGFYLHSTGPHSLLQMQTVRPNCMPIQLTWQRYNDTIFIHVFVDCILDWDLCAFMSAQPSTNVICVYTQNDKIVFSLFVFPLEFRYPFRMKLMPFVFVKFFFTISSFD